MILEIFDANRERVGMINQYKYASYTNKFNGIGTFEIKIPVVDKSVALLVKGNYILFDEGIMGIITKRNKISSDSEEITINGYIVSYLLTYRVIPKTQEYYGTVEEITEQMINNNFISPSDKRRIISYIVVNNKAGKGTKRRIQKTGDDVESAIETVLSLENKGFYFKPIISKYDEDLGVLTNIANFEFGVIVPTDRSFNNAEGNNPIVFSVELKNLEEIEFDEDGSDYKNVAVVAGSDEGENRIILEVGNVNVSGIERVEMYVDARDLSNTQINDNGEEVKISDEDYNELLQSRGEEALKECEVTIDVEGKVITKGKLANSYGTEYFLGDYVSIIDSSLGYVVNAQITAFKKTISDSVENIDFTFGYEKQSLRRILKKKGVV
jgi:hypothetical protein